MIWDLANDNRVLFSTIPERERVSEIVRGSLLSERECLRANSENLQVQKQTLQAERDSLQSDRENLLVKRKALQSEQDSLQSERDAL